MSFSSIARGIARRGALLPFRWLNAMTRTQAIDQLLAESIVTYEGTGVSLRLFAPTPILLHRAATLISKEPDTIAWLTALPRESVLWDIGANVGVFSLFAASRVGCEVLAFEPSAANYYVLTRNIQINRLERRITAYCVALSGASRLGTLNLHSAALGASMSQFGDFGEQSRYSDGDGGLVHGMVGLTIDDFVRRFEPPFPTALKIDVDGLELAILEGASTVLGDTRLTSVMVELSLSNEAEQKNAVAHLARAGFRLKSVGERQGNAGEYAANHLFVRE